MPDVCSGVWATSLQVGNDGRKCRCWKEKGDRTSMCVSRGINEYILVHHQTVSLWLSNNRINAAFKNEVDYISDLRNVHGEKSKLQNNVFPVIPLL